MRKNWTLKVLLICCFLVLGASSPVFSAANLVKNGDFENGLTGWRTDQTNTVELVPGPDGRGRCVRISSTNGKGCTYLTQTMDPNLIKGSRLRVEAMVKAEGVVLGTYEYSNARITLAWDDGKGNPNNGREAGFLGTFAWKKASAVWDVGKDCVSATLYLGFHTTTGTVWFDDVTVTVLE